MASTFLSLLGVASELWLVFVLLVIGGLGSAALHPVGTTIASTQASNATLGVGHDHRVTDAGQGDPEPLPLFIDEGSGLLAGREPSCEHPGKCPKEREPRRGRDQARCDGDSVVMV